MMTTFRGLPRHAWVALVALTMPMAACDVDKLLEVEDPDTVNEETLEDPNFIDVLVTGAIGDFTGAYSGTGGDAFLSTTSLLTDEFFSTGTFGTRTATDRRLQQTPSNGNTSDGAYVNLQQARRALNRAAGAVAQHPDKGTDDPDYSLVQALHGYTYVALGEAFCSHVPISTEDDEGGFPIDGPPRTSAQLFEEALPLFDESGTDLAKIGKARAQLNLGQFAAAAATVAGVPTEYNWFIEHSDNAANNPFFALQSNGRYSISHHEGGNGTGLPFRGAGDGFDDAGQDPRVPWFEDEGGGFDPQFRLFVTLKYPYRTSGVPLASGIEARLIEAEAALQTGGDWLGILNDLRAQVGTLMAAQVDDYPDWVSDPSLDPLTDPGTEDGRVDLVMSERAMWLWGTGHRVADLRRMVNYYGRSEAEVYPSGGYHKGGNHGSDVVFPVDFDEGNNALFDPAQCVVTSASFN
jgi:hypothetical protein